MGLTGNYNSTAPRRVSMPTILLCYKATKELISTHSPDFVVCLEPGDIQDQYALCDNFPDSHEMLPYCHFMLMHRKSGWKRLHPDGSSRQGVFLFQHCIETTEQHSIVLSPLSTTCAVLAGFPDVPQQQNFMECMQTVFHTAGMFIDSC